MSTSLPPAEVLVARGEPLEALKGVLAAIRNEESNRRWKAAAKEIAPWAVACMATLFALGAGLLVWHRPVPRDHFQIALVHADNTFDMLREREELPPAQKKILTDYTVIKLFTAWENYQFRRNQDNYNFISAITVGEDLRKVYQQRWQENNPDNPDTKYGNDATRDVIAIQLVPIKNTPYAVDAIMLVRLHKPSSTTCQKLVGRVTFKEDTKHLIPVDVQKVYDPLDVIVDSYVSYPDPAQPQTMACP